MRPVCQFWKNFIEEDFPLELTINQGNCERLFKCSNATSVNIQSLASEYSGRIAFGSKLRSLQFSGKVLSSNIFSILRFCPDLEKLSFCTLKQVLGIEGVESVKLPKVTTVEIKVRPDQETFSSDEIIIINILRQIVFGSLETIMISTGSPYELWLVDGDEVDYNPSQVSARRYPEETDSVSISEDSPMSMTTIGSNASGTQYNSEDARVEEPLGSNSPVVGESRDPRPTQPGTSTNNAEESGPQAAGTQTTNPNLHVLITRAANFPNNSGSEAATSTSRTSPRASRRRMRHTASEFEARLFYANLELLLMEDTGSHELNVFNDSVSRNRMESIAYFDIPGLVEPAVKHTVFFEFVKNNHSTLKNLYVRNRSDFMCFGNLNGFSRDVSKVQFEEVDYSFGRMQMCYESGLLRAQSKLKKLKVQVLDDMWRHLMLAVENSQKTLTDLDIKILSVNEDRVDITAISGCSILKTLKLFHFFEKESVSSLPKTLNKLVLNGPVLYSDMEDWTRDLVELEDLTLLLNVRGDKIDLELYKKFLKMPKMNKLTFIQCPMELDSIKSYIDNMSSKNGFKFWINGPQVIRDFPAIQYVCTSISPEQFNREQIEIEGS